jgi:hypothetical protein
MMANSRARLLGTRVWNPTKLRIFKTHASHYWQVRCFLKGRTHTQSLKTTNKQAAISQAKHFFHIKIAVKRAETRFFYHRRSRISSASQMMGNVYLQ